MSEEQTESTQVVADPVASPHEETKTEATPVVADPVAPVPAPPVQKTVEEWGAEKTVNPIWLRGMRAGNKWPKGHHVTEQEFNDALERVKNISVG